MKKLLNRVQLITEELILEIEKWKDASAEFITSIMKTRLLEKISAFICVHLRLIFVSLSDRTQEIRFELFPIQEKIEPENDLINSPQRAQSSIFTTYEKAAPSRFRTRMTRIFTDPCASASSAQSVFYCTPSAFIYVHLLLLKLIFQQITLTINKNFTYTNPS